MATTLLGPESKSGFKFDLTISIGTVIQILAFIILGTAGWVTVQSNQGETNRVQQEQGQQLKQIMEKQEQAAELGAREAAIIDGIERRIGRVEEREDRRK